MYVNTWHEHAQLHRQRASIRKYSRTCIMCKVSYIIHTHSALCTLTQRYLCMHCKYIGHARGWVSVCCVVRTRFCKSTGPGWVVVWQLALSAPQVRQCRRRRQRRRPRRKSIRDCSNKSTHTHRQLYIWAFVHTEHANNTFHGDSSNGKKNQHTFLF